MLGKSISVNRGRSDDDLEIWPARQYLTQIAQQEIDVQRALVGLVNNDRVIGLQQRIGLRFGQQNTVGHQFDRGIPAEPVLKTHFETHYLTQRSLQFFRNALGHRRRCNSAWLGVANEFAALGRLAIGQCGGVIAQPPPHGQRNLGQLRGFPRTCFTADDHHLMLCYGVRDFLAFTGNRKGFWKIDFQGTGGQGAHFVENRGLSLSGPGLCPLLPP